MESTSSIHHEVIDASDRSPRPPHFLRSAGGGFGALALAALLAEDGLLASRAADPLAPKKPHFAPTAKRVIFLFMSGGPSHVDTFDPKPDLHAPARPAAARVVRPGQDAPRRRQEQAARARSAPSRSTAKSGIEVSDWLPHIGDVRRRPVRPARLLRRQRHAPRVGLPDEHRLDPDGPAEPRRVGDLRPRHREPATCRRSSCCPTPAAGPRAARPRGATASCPPRTRARSSAAARRRSRTCERRRACRPRSSGARSTSSTQLNRDHLATRGGDSELAARIAAYELAFRMQAHAPEVVDLAQETRGDEDGSTASTARRPPSSALRCLLARRMVERGVRFVQLYCGDTNGWDAHSDLEGNHGKLCAAERPADRRAADGPEAARPARIDTLVIWGGEFGRTPMTEGTNGRDHNPHGFCDVAGRRRREGRPGRSARPTRSACAPPRTRPTSTTSTRRSCTCSASTTRKLTFRHNGRNERLTDNGGEVIEQGAGLIVGLRFSGRGCIDQ